MDESDEKRSLRGRASVMCRGEKSFEGIKKIIYRWRGLEGSVSKRREVQKNAFIFFNEKEGKEWSSAITFGLL